MKAPQNAQFISAGVSSANWIARKRASLRITVATACLIVVVVTVVLAARGLFGGSPSTRPQAGKVLSQFSGGSTNSNIRDSRSFLVSTSSLVVSYSFDCHASGEGGQGIFIADLQDGYLPGSDDRPLADTSGARRSTTVTVHPKHGGLGAGAARR